MSEMLMADFLVNSPSGITSGKKSFSEAQKGGHFENLKYETQLQFDLRYEKYRPKLGQKSIFMITSSMTSKGGLKIGPLYSW